MALPLSRDPSSAVEPAGRGLTQKKSILLFLSSLPVKIIVVEMNEPAEK